ncbi:MAG TPA: PfkB family carbohydrate kinase [Thermoleophilaceae bacterium]
MARVAIFGPHPVLTVTIERRNEGEDDVHLHAGGQGVWVARMAGELGAEPVLCGFIGGETGLTLAPLLERLPGECRLVPTGSRSGCYVQDRRSGQRELVSAAWSDPPSRHELDDLFSVTTAAAVDSDVLVICNPAPGDVLPLEVYANLVSDVRSNGTPVLVDLSSPRLDSALQGAPDLVKLNDWELAEYMYGPVSEPAEMRAAAERLRDAGAGLVVVTRAGDPAFVLDGDQAWELVPPRFERGSREGCGDSMMGGLAAAWAQGLDWKEALRRGAAAGAANFLRHGLGTGSREVIEELLPRVQLHPAG